MTSAGEDLPSHLLAYDAAMKLYATALRARLAACARANALKKKRSENVSEGAGNWFDWSGYAGTFFYGEPGYYFNRPLPKKKPR